MLPAVKGKEATYKQILIYSILLFPVALSPYILGYTSIGYGIAAAILSGFFIFTAVRVYTEKTDRTAKLMFGYSVFYLFAILLAVMIYA